jgi:hypothetical protein
MPQTIQTIGGKIHVDIQSTVGVSLATTAKTLSELGITVVAGSVANGNHIRAKFATISVEGFNVRYGFGANIAPNVGHQLQPGDVVNLQGDSELAKARFCNEASASKAELYISVAY